MGYKNLNTRQKKVSCLSFGKGVLVAEKRPGGEEPAISAPRGGKSSWTGAGPSKRGYFVWEE